MVDSFRGEAIRITALSSGSVGGALSRRRSAVRKGSRADGVNCRRVYASGQFFRSQTISVLFTNYIDLILR